MLRFTVAPHIVQDLGLNLYTSLPRVLVEFVANAYDADSPTAEIRMDFERIVEARKEMKNQWEIERLETELANRKGAITPEVQRLSERTLPEQIEIVIEDRGHGMSRDDLEQKFLVAGRSGPRPHPGERGRITQPRGSGQFYRKDLTKLGLRPILQSLDTTPHSGLSYTPVFGGVLWATLDGSHGERLLRSYCCS
jgi:hypothetical protein